MHASGERRSRLPEPSAGALFAALFVLLAAANAAHLSDPPYWDAVVGVYRQGVWLARHHMDYAGLMREAVYADGGPRVHPLYLFSAVFAGLIRLLPPAGTFFVLHLTMLAAAALGLTAHYRVMRTQVPAAHAAAWLAAAATGPIWAGQTASLYLEMPMVGLLGLSALALWRGRYRSAALWSLAAYFVKSAALLEATALFCAGAVLLAIAAREPARAEDRGLAWLLVPLPAMILLNRLAGQSAAPDALVWSAAPGYVERLIAQAPYLYPALLAQLALIALGAACAGKDLRALLAKRADARWTLFLLLWVGGFWAAFALTQRNLVRYTVFAALPAAGLLAVFWRSRPRLSLALALSLIAWNLFNLRGFGLRPLPPIVGRSGDRLERSREYLDDLRADQELAALLSRDFPNEPVVARWPFPQMLRFPELGYVSSPLPDVIDASRPPLRGETAAATPEELVGRATLCVYAPSVFEQGAPSLRPRDGDEPVWIDRRLPAPLILYRRVWRPSDFAAGNAP